MCTAARGFEDFKNWCCDEHLCSSWRYFAWHRWPSLAAPQDGYRCDVAILSYKLCALTMRCSRRLLAQNAAELNTLGSARKPFTTQLSAPLVQPGSLQSPDQTRD